MIHTTKHNFILFNALFCLTFSIGTINANVNNYATAKLFEKYQHNVEDECKSAQCQNTEKCLELIMKKINNNYALHETNSLSNLEQDKATLKKIKKEATYWFWPNHPNDNTIRIQAEESLKNIQQTKDFLQHHTAYLQAQKITALYETMPVNNEAFKIWVTQKFSNFGENPIINCRRSIQTAITTIDHFSIENRIQYPQLYHQLSYIKNKIDKIFPTLEALYQTAYEQQKLEKIAREQRELQQKQIDAQNKASQTQELYAQTEREKTHKMQELLFVLTTLQLHARSEQAVADIKSIQSLIYALEQLLHSQDSQEQQLSRDLSRLQKMMNVSLEYEKLTEKHINLLKAIEKNKIKIQTLQAQQAALQVRVENTVIPSQTEHQTLQTQIAQRKRELQEQNQLIHNLDLPIAQPCSADNSYVEVQAHYAPEQNNNPRPPAYNPNYREEQ